MNLSRSLFTAAVFAALGSTASAQLQVRSIDFEAADPADVGALSNLGFGNYVNVFDPTGSSFLYGYGFPANNQAGEGTLVVTGLGGGAQGAQAMQTDSNYNNGGAHGAGELVETNTFISQNISADSIGDTWTFDFDYIKSTNVATSATTGAFIKVLDSVGGSFATLAFELLDTTGASDTTWAAGQVSITIDPAWDGQLLQFGFINTCSNFEDSGRIYDNIEWQGPPPPPPTMTPYAQDFDGLDINNGDALSNEGWIIYANVFDPSGGYLYGYGTFPAPNPGIGFSAITDTQQAADQGSQSLVVYSDYNNGDHANGNYIEASVFKEQIVQSANVGQYAIFSFDVKKSDFVGNGQGDAQMYAFIKVLDPAQGFATIRETRLDVTDNSIRNWENATLTLELDPGTDGKIFQIGYGSYASNYDDTGVLYDNIELSFIDIDELNGAPGTYAVIDEGTTLWNPEYATDSGVGFACGQGESDLWFIYFAESDSEIAVSTAGSDFDTILQVFDASNGAFIACHDDVAFPTDPTSALSFSGTAGNPYWIQVSGWGAAGSEFGSGVLSINEGIGTQICSAQANDSGAGASLVLNGSAIAADNDLTLDVRGLPTDSLGYFLTSGDTIFLAGAGGSAGDLCIASTSIGRYAGNILDSGAAGAVSFSPDLTSIPGPTGTVAATAGETRYFQYWTRDLSGGTPTSNFSTAAGITFQ